MCASFGSLAQLVEQLAFDVFVQASNPWLRSEHVKPESEADLRKMNGRQAGYGSLAQLVEQLAFNQLVEGSNPSRPTNKPDCLRAIWLKKRALGLFFFACRATIF